MPISTYGTSKFACEALITAYSYTYDFKAIIYRLANIVGPRSRHGVIFDFVEKLRRSPGQLEILGDGTQTKSYLNVKDCIDAVQPGLAKSSAQVEIFNVGSEDQALQLHSPSPMNLSTIVSLVCIRAILGVWLMVAMMLRILFV